MLKGALVEWPLALDGRELTRLVQSSYVVKDVPPGEHYLSRIGWNGDPTLIQVEQGRTYFLGYDIGLLGVDFYPLTPSSAEQMTSVYTRVKPLF